MSSLDEDRLSCGTCKVLIAWALVMFFSIVLCLTAFCVVGCQAGDGRQGTIELLTEPVVRAVVKAEVQAGVVEIQRTVTDQSQRAVEATQRAAVAIQNTDQSTSDKWVNRISVVSLGIALITETVVLIIMAWSSVLRKRIYMTQQEKDQASPATWIDQSPTDLQP